MDLSTAFKIFSKIINKQEYILLSIIGKFEKIITLAFSVKESLFKGSPWKTEFFVR